MVKRIGKILLYSGCRDEDGLNLRLWFIFYLIYLTTLVAMAVFSLQYYDQHSHNLALCGWLLALYLFYLSLCCTFFPAPTTWLVLLMASPIVGLIKPPMLAQLLHLSQPPADWVVLLTTILLVAGVGSLGTALANLNEYHLFSYLLRCHRVHKVRQTRLYLKTARYFDISPFSLTTLFSFLPLPVDIVRWLAITHRYRRDHYFLGNFLGRFCRYGMLAGAAGLCKIGWVGIAAIQFALFALILLRYLPKLLKYYREHRRHDPAAPKSIIPKPAPVIELAPTKGMTL
ncbi:hypothetical protein ACFL02_05670 [Planctomycetota bacterium]